MTDPHGLRAEAKVLVEGLANYLVESESRVKPAVTALISLAVYLYHDHGGDKQDLIDGINGTYAEYERRTKGEGDASERN